MMLLNGTRYNIQHSVNVYSNGEPVGKFSIPPTDPRFVKADDIIEIAWDMASRRTNIAEHYSIPEWDYLEVFFYGMTLKCCREGKQFF